jgi:hypothetical protein
MKWFYNFSSSQFAGSIKKPFTEALKSLFLKTRSWSLIDTTGATLGQRCVYGITRRYLTRDEFNNIQSAFFDDFRRWRELIMKSSRKIVEKYKEVNQ